jgi:hypothetical protein
MAVILDTPEKCSVTLSHRPEESFVRQTSDCGTIEASVGSSALSDFNAISSFTVAPGATAVERNRWVVGAMPPAEEDTFRPFT